MRIAAPSKAELEQRGKERAERDEALVAARRLARAAGRAGLTVTTLQPMSCHGGWGECFLVQMWASDGRLWMEGSHESADSVRDAVALYKANCKKRERKTDPVRRKALKIKPSGGRRRG